VVNLPTYSYLPERQTTPPEVNYEERFTTEEQHSTTSLNITGSFHSESKRYNGDTVGMAHNVSEKEQTVANDRNSEKTPNWNHGQWRSIGGHQGNAEQDRNEVAGRKFRVLEQLLKTEYWPTNCTILDPNCKFIHSTDMGPKSSELIINNLLRIINNLHNKYESNNESTSGQPDVSNQNDLIEFETRTMKSK
jgi:hypothetical protein